MPTKEELYELATEYQIEGRSSMSKAELIEAIKRAGGRVPDDDDTGEDTATAVDGAISMPTKEELYELAAEYEIEGRSSMGKAELIEAIRRAGGSVPDDDDTVEDDARAGDRVTARDAASEEQQGTRLRKTYASYAESVMAAQNRHALEYNAIVERFVENLNTLARDTSGSNPFPAYLQNLLNAYFAGDTATVNDANTKLLRHLQELGRMVETRYASTVRRFLDEVSDLHDRSRGEYVSQAAAYADEVQSAWKSSPDASADAASLDVLQHGLVVGAVARTLDALGARSDRVNA
jgi:hypothetical protein